MSEHFALAEFLASDTARAMGIDNFPTWDIVDNLNALAFTMEQVRELLDGAPIAISSGFRCKELNYEVGGVADSAHLTGLACDFTAPSFGGVQAIIAVLRPHLIMLAVDQLIDEGSWVHLGLTEGTPRHQCFVA